MTQQTFIIIGASLTGASAAEQLRSEGFNGDVVLVGEEARPPYERPPLSKGYLRGEEEADAFLVQPRDRYAEQGIDLRLSTRATAIVPGTREVVLDDGHRLSYDRLLLATGSAPRRIDVPGADLRGIHYLRTVEDSDAIREASSGVRHAVVVGAGWIGSEVAASLRALDVSVTMIAPGSAPLESVLGPEVGGVYGDLHREHGVDLRMGRHVVAFQGEETVTAVEIDDGQRVETELVVVGIGARPRIDLARDAGLAVGDGILADETLETSAPGIFAAGDVASVMHPAFDGRLRVEHWDNARRQGRHAARNMLAIKEPYTRQPYFFSDQYDLGMEYRGHATDRDAVVFRGRPEEREFIAFWLRDGRVMAAMNANVWNVAKPISALITSRRTVAVDRLADTSVALDDLDALAAAAG